MGLSVTVSVLSPKSDKDIVTHGTGYSGSIVQVLFDKDKDYGTLWDLYGSSVSCVSGDKGSHQKGLVLWVLKGKVNKRVTSCTSLVFLLYYSPKDLISTWYYRLFNLISIFLRPEEVRRGPYQTSPSRTWESNSSECRERTQDPPSTHPNTPNPLQQSSRPTPVNGPCSVFQNPSLKVVGR